MGRRVSWAEGAFGRHRPGPEVSGSTGAVPAPLPPSSVRGREQQQSSSVYFFVDGALERKATPSVGAAEAGGRASRRPGQWYIHSEPQGFGGRMLDPGFQTSLGLAVPPLSRHSSFPCLSSVLRGSDRPSRGVALSLAPLGLLEAVPPIPDASSRPGAGRIHCGACEHRSYPRRQSKPTEVYLAGRERDGLDGKFGLHQGTGEQI